MNLNRRKFLQLSAAGVGAAYLDGLGLRPAQGAKVNLTKGLAIKRAKEVTTICPYCGVGCGLICHSSRGKVINTEGDPEHPINEGGVCSKGASLFQVANNPRRAKYVLHRKPNSEKWDKVSWDYAINRIAALAKKTRDATFRRRDMHGNVINRTEAIAGLGGAALDNEECHLYTKFARGLGIVYLEHQARI